MGGLVLGRHELESELLDAVRRHRQADQAAAVPRHEIDDHGLAFLRGNDEIAFVLAVLVVDEDEHAAVTGVFDHLLDGRKL